MNNKILVLIICYSAFPMLFVAYELYLMYMHQPIYEFQEMDSTWRYIAMVIQPFTVVIPAVYIGFINNENSLKHGIAFGVFVSICAIIIDKKGFWQIMGSDALFSAALLFSDFFIFAVLATGFGAAIARQR